MTLVQLLAAGLTHSAVAKRVARGALHRVHRGVYAVGHAALSREGRWLAVVLAAGDTSALGDHAAAQLHQITRFHSPLIAVVSTRKRRIAGARVHTVRNLDPRDLTTHLRIPVTTVHRTLVDLSDLLTPHQLTYVIKEAAFRGRYVEPAVRDAMQRANGRHNLQVLERAITLYNGGSAGTKSSYEDAFLRLDTRLPEPLVNHQLLGHEVDFHWPDRMLAVEIDGDGHGRPPVRRADAQKDEDLRDAGYTVLRFTDDDVTYQPEVITRALRARA